jgi:hypothetical protein
MLVLAAIASLAATGACASQPVDTGTADTSRADVTFPVPPLESIPALTHRDYRVLRDMPLSADGAPIEFYGFIDRTTMAAVERPVGADGTGSPPPDRLVAYDLSTGSTKVLWAPAPSASMTSIGEVSSDGGYLSWLQTQKEGPSSDWSIHSYDLSSSTAREIASSDQLDIADPELSSFTGATPQIVDGQAYWTAHHAWVGDEPETAAYRAPLDGSARASKVFDDVTAVYAAGHDLRFERDGRMLAWDVSAAAEKTAGEIHQTHPGGGTYADGTLAQVDRRGTEEDSVDDVVITEKSGRRTTLRGVRNLSDLEVSSRWVGYSDDENAFVYDLRRRRLMRLPGSTNFQHQPFSGNRLFYVQQHAGTPKDPHPTTYPLIALLPE